MLSNDLEQSLCLVCLFTRSTPFRRCTVTVFFLVGCSNEPHPPSPRPKPVQPNLNERSSLRDFQKAYPEMFACFDPTRNPTPENRRYETTMRKGVRVVTGCCHEARDSDVRVGHASLVSVNRSRMLRFPVPRSEVSIATLATLDLAALVREPYDHLSARFV